LKLTRHKLKEAALEKEEDFLHQTKTLVGSNSEWLNRMKLIAMARDFQSRKCSMAPQCLMTHSAQLTLQLFLNNGSHIFVKGKQRR